MSLSASLSRLGLARVRPILVATGVAALLSACGDASTAPSSIEPSDAPSLSVTSTSKVLRIAQRCTGTTCVFDASTSVGFYGFSWIFLSGTTRVVPGTVATHTFPANGTFTVVLQARHSAGTGQVMKSMVCANGTCY